MEERGVDDGSVAREDGRGRCNRGRSDARCAVILAEDY